MARTVRDTKIDTRERRLKLEPGKRYWRAIHQGLALGYRRNARGSGSWLIRLLQADGTYALKTLGIADDHTDADGKDVLDFKQAQAGALLQAEEARRNQGILPTHKSTVKDAADSYLKWFRQHRRSVTETEAAINSHILPALGGVLLSALTSQKIRQWHETLAEQPGRLRTARSADKPNLRPEARSEDEKRARKATANRIFTVLKALLNRAFQDGLVTDDIEWRKVKPFGKVDNARIRFLSDEEGVRLVNACSPDLRRLVWGALLTGCRFGELVAMRVQDVDLKGGRVYVSQSKSGKPRHIPLNPEGVKHFQEAVAGKMGEELVFLKADGREWGKNHHVRVLQAACEAAKVEPAISFHELRHTYASHLAQAGVDLLTISKLLGHADTRITSRHYAHLADKTLAAAVTKLPSFGAQPAGKVKALSPRRAQA